MVHLIHICNSIIFLHCHAMFAVKVSGNIHHGPVLTQLQRYMDHGPVFTIVCWPHSISPWMVCDHFLEQLQSLQGHQHKVLLLQPDQAAALLLKQWTSSHSSFPTIWQGDNNRGQHFYCNRKYLGLNWILISQGFKLTKIARILVTVACNPSLRIYLDTK